MVRHDEHCDLYIVKGIGCVAGLHLIHEGGGYGLCGV